MFGRAATPRKNPGFHTERYWIDYKFQARLYACASARTCGRRIRPGWWAMTTRALPSLGILGNFDVTAAAVYQFESQRLGLTNDNDFIYYTFSAGYNLKPHRFQLDVTYFRDRFLGADTQSPRPVHPHGAAATRGSGRTVC